MDPYSFAEFGDRSLMRAGRIAELGPRPPGSHAHSRVQELIDGELASLHCEVEHVKFTAMTPTGMLPMRNTIAKFAGRSGQIIVLCGHYDTIRTQNVRPVGRRVKLWRFIRYFAGTSAHIQTGFTGANDGGSSTALLLQMADMLNGQNLEHDVWIVLFDGEEAILQWRAQDHTYGSRHQVEFWEQRDVLGRIRCLINVDMIGHCGLQLFQDVNSSPRLRELVWRIGRKLGYARQFQSSRTTSIQDDHIPFVNAGVEAINLIGWNYGPRNGFWHTEEDTFDKLCAASFSMMGHLLNEVLEELQSGQIHEQH